MRLWLASQREDRIVHPQRLGRETQLANSFLPTALCFRKIGPVNVQDTKAATWWAVLMHF